MTKRLGLFIVALVMFVSIQSPIWAAVNTVVAKPAAATVLVNGAQKQFTAYEIGGSNYFMLRDLAYVLNGSAKEFNVAWNSNEQALEMTSGVAYQVTGEEMKSATSARDKTATLANVDMYLNGQQVSFTAYFIEGHTYFKLRDIMQTFNVGVLWDEAGRTIRMETSLNYGQESAGSTVASSPSAENIAKNTDKVVLLYNCRRNGAIDSLGTGFMIGNGRIVTNYHVVEDAYIVCAVLSDDSVCVMDQLLCFDEDRDIAVLYASALADLPGLPLGDSAQIVIGQSIVTIGNPQGLRNTISTGVVSGMRDSHRYTGAKDIQISAPMATGSSGGPLFDLNGKVMGITYAIVGEGQNLNFAIPINELQTVLMKNNRVLYGNFDPKTLETANRLAETADAFSKKYAYNTIGGYSILLDGMALEWAEDYPNQIDYYIYITDETSLAHLRTLLSTLNGQNMVADFFHTMVREVSADFPTANHYGLVIYYTSFPNRPAADDYDVVEYDAETGRWDAYDAPFAFYCDQAQNFNYYSD